MNIRTLLLCLLALKLPSGRASHLRSHRDAIPPAPSSRALGDAKSQEVTLKGQACDRDSQGERYLSQSSSKVSDLAACKKSCEEELICQSITFYADGWCSHFSTRCEKTKLDSNAITMRLATIESPFGARYGRTCDKTKGERYLGKSSIKVSDLTVCRKSCEDEAKCQSIAFYRSGWCSHFSTKCENTKSDSNAIAMRLKDFKPPAPIAGTLSNQECDISQGERSLSKSSGKVSDLAACKKSCEDELMCQSITYYASGWCSHFITKCESTKPDSNANSMRLKDYLLNSKACDKTRGEINLGQSSGKVPDLAACKKSCEDEAKCQSITFYWSGWCSHFSTKCEKMKSDSDAIAMRLATTATTTTTAGKLLSNSLHTMVVLSGGSLFTSGYNSDGQLGDGSKTDRTKLVKVIDHGVKAVAAGCLHSMAIKQDGSLWAAGSNRAGQLGIRFVSYKASFTKVMDGDVQAVAAGCKHTMVLKQDGSLWAAGSNSAGQIGDNHKEWSKRETFIKVIDHGVKAVAAGGWHSIVIKQGGSLWAAGENNYEQLGIDKSGAVYGFVKVIDGGVKTVSAGECYSLVVKEDGSLWAAGECGAGGPSCSSYAMNYRKFVKVMDGGVKAVSAGNHHSVVIKEDGSLWGTGNKGAFGLSQAQWRALVFGKPIKLMNSDKVIAAEYSKGKPFFFKVMASGVKAAAAGNECTMVIKERDSGSEYIDLWAAGENRFIDLQTDNFMKIGNYIFWPF